MRASESAPTPHGMAGTAVSEGPAWPASGRTRFRTKLAAMEL